MTTQNTVCDAVRAYFRSQKISIEEAARRLGMSRPAVSQQLTGRPFSHKSAARWSEAFGFSASYLLTGEGSLLPGEPAKAATPGAVTLPGELVGMFTDMAATIRSQQDTVAQLSDLVGRLATGAQAQPWAEKKQPAASIADDGLPQ